VRAIVFCHDHRDGTAFDPLPEETEKRDVELVSEPPGRTFAAVGWRTGGLRAAALAASYQSQVDRLVLCCVPIPTDERPLDPGAITAKTLLVYGQLDEEAPFRHARWWKKHLRDARVEMVPRRGNDIIDVMWKRILSHAAPHTLRPPR
jgi:pimeloyl-ACP methyl ester carboxylesterase